MADSLNYLVGTPGHTLHVYNNHAVISEMTTMPAFRLFRWFGSPPAIGFCPSGVAADGVTGHDWTWYPPGGGASVYFKPAAGYFATRGQLAKVESGGAFAAGANLQSDASGRAITHASGPVVLRALEAATAAGQICWCVFS